MKQNDARLICQEDKRKKIKESMDKTKAKRSSQIGRVFELKINRKRLSSKQREEIERLFLEGKWFYNYVLGLSEKEKISLSKINTTEIKEVKRFDKDKNEITEQLKQLSSQEKQRILSNMIASQKTIKTLFEGGKQKEKGKLQFKTECRMIPLKQYKNTYIFKSDRSVRISGISGEMLIKGTDQFIYDKNVEFADAKLIKKPDGYYLHVTTFIDKKFLERKEKKNGKELGIDFGCQDSLVFSDGRKLNIQIEESERLKKLQTKFNRRLLKLKKQNLPRSNNLRKLQNLIQREYQKTTNKKKDAANKICHEIKQYDLVVIQDEQLAKWQKSRHGKKIQHSCLGLVKAKLKSYSNVIILDKFIPTTKFCSKCGKKHDGLKLWDRTFKCSCGVEMDRDVHAAQNMLDIFHLTDDFFRKENLVPTEHREVKLADFKKMFSGTERFRNHQSKVDARRCEVFSLA